MGSSRQIQLYDLNQKIRLNMYDKKSRSTCRYIFCTTNVSNILILALLQLLTSSSVYLLFFEFTHINGKVFYHTLFAAVSYFVGCLLGGILLSKMAASRIKSSKGKVRNLRCVFASMYSVSLFGSLLLIVVNQIENLKQGYVEVIIFIVQLGISSSFVTINVAVLVLVAVSHRLKVLAMLQVINVLSICLQPSFASYLALHNAPTYALITASSLGLILGVMISHRAAEKANAQLN